MRSLLLGRGPRSFALLILASLAEPAVQAKAPPIEIDVDATEVVRRIIHAKLVIPVSPGPLTLYYPKWIPGEHGPNGPITDLAGLKMLALGMPLSWRRDEADMYAFHCHVPRDAQAVEVHLDYLSPPSTATGFSSAASVTARLAVLNWNQFLLYPKGPPMSKIEYRARLRLPPGWKFGSALPIASQAGPQVTFAPVSLETLVDSTVLCGQYFREVPIGPTEGPPHFLEIACDSAAGLDLSPELKAKFDRLVAETGALFGARHYQSYRFLLALSDHVAHFGEEHHQSTDIRGAERSLVDETIRTQFIGVCPHEFVHSWNGKHRRPADMVTEDYQQPERTRLLWVYEGLTQYLGMELTARCGFWTDDETREYLAHVVESQQNQRGRSWRPLEDTAVAAQLLYEARSDWFAWRRSVDFYDEGILIWLEVDTLIRQQTKGERSLDDFCRRFLGGENGPPTVKPYTFEDVVAALNAVAPYDWKELLTRRVTATADQAPLDGLRRSGWRLSYTDKEPEYLRGHETTTKKYDFTASIGLLLGEDGAVADIIPGKAADKARIAPGMKLVAVNGRRWSRDLLKTALKATKKSQGPLELLLENEEFFKTYPLDYHDGLKYPQLEQDKGQKDLLAEILKARAPANASVKPAGLDK
jgi:predicted metalloprotease with PDZ domain